MNKEQKTAVVEELSKELSDSNAIFAVDYRGISVPQAAELRASLREAGARFRVVKNRLTLLAAEKAGTDELKGHLEGPTALTFVSGDAALAAKTIFKLGSEWEVLEYKGGLMDGDVLDPDSFKAIAKLPGRDALNAQAAGLIASPLTGLVRGLGSMVQGLAMQLKQIADQGLVTGEESPAEEAPAEEAPVEETPKEVEPPAETPKEDEAPAGADAETASEDAGGGSEDASSDGEAGSEEPKADADPEPEDSPEEAPSEEKAPEGEDAGPAVEETGEGDADVGEETQTSEDSDEEKKEEDS